MKRYKFIGGPHDGKTTIKTTREFYTHEKQEDGTYKEVLYLLSGYNLPDGTHELAYRYEG